MYTEERADAGSRAVEVEGLRGASLGAGEKLRVEADWKDDVVEAVSVKVVDLWVTGL
jgi:gamma-glutamyl-gamma-aminobutyrate hydrolase PuuD